MDYRVDFGLSERQVAVRRMVREFVDREVLPVIDRYDREGRYPLDIIAKMAGLGLLGSLIPPKYGGAGLDYLSHGLVCEELARGCNVLASVVSVANSLVATPLLLFGQEELRQKYLPHIAQGETLAAAGLTEPGGGTDLASLQTTATRHGDSYILNGSKVFVSNANHCQVFLVLATVDKALKHRGIMPFMVERAYPGFSTRPLAMRILRRGDLGELTFQDCRVPAANRIGEEGQGFRIIGSALDIARFSVACRLVGTAQACVDLALKYARERTAFGQQIGRFEMIQDMVANMVCGLEAARLLAYRVGHLKNQGVERISREAALAKLFAGEALARIASDAVQIHGAYGLSDEFPIGRYYEEAKVGQIAEGTSQILKVLVAEYTLGYRRIT